MSYFIANSISFSKDLKTFKVKGGDNNVVPRSNYWIPPIPIDELYNEIHGGMIQLNHSTEKLCFVDTLVKDMKFGGGCDKTIDYYHIHLAPNAYSKELQTKYKWFNTEFKTRLVAGLKSLSSKKEYVVQLNNYNNSYIKSTHGHSCFGTTNIDRAKTLSKYKATVLASKYNGVSIIKK